MTTLDSTSCEDGNVPSCSSFLSSSSLPRADLDEERQNSISLEKQKFFRSCPFYRGGRKSISSSTPSQDNKSFPSLPLPSSMTSLMSSISKSYLARPRRLKDNRDTGELWGFAAAAARKSLLPVTSFIKPPVQRAASIVKPPVINLDAIKSCTLKPPTLTFDEMRNSKSGAFGQLSSGFTGLFNGLTSHSFHTGPGSLFSHVARTNNSHTSHSNHNTSNDNSPPRSNPYSFPCDTPDIPLLPSSCSRPSVGIENEKALPGKLTTRCVCAATYDSSMASVQSAASLT